MPLWPAGNPDVASGPRFFSTYYKEIKALDAVARFMATCRSSLEFLDFWGLNIGFLTQKEQTLGCIAVFKKRIIWGTERASGSITTMQPKKDPTALERVRPWASASAFQCVPFGCSSVFPFSPSQWTHFTLFSLVALPFY